MLACLHTFFVNLSGLFYHASTNSGKHGNSLSDNFRRGLCQHLHLHLCDTSTDLHRHLHRTRNARTLVALRNTPVLVAVYLDVHIM